MGYLAGVIHKALYAFDWVIALYVINMGLIAIDLFLYFKYRVPTSNNTEQ